MSKPQRNESTLYLKAPRWALEQLIDFFAAMQFGGDLVDSKSAFEAFNELRAIHEPPNLVTAKLIAELRQASETRDAAQAEATRQTLRARELERQLGEAVRVGDIAWGYLEGALRPCDADCQCVLHDFEKAKASGVPFATKPTPTAPTCTCRPSMSGPYGSARRVDNPSCPQHHPVGPRCAACGSKHWPDEACERRRRSKWCERCESYHAPTMTCVPKCPRCQSPLPLFHHYVQTPGGARATCQHPWHEVML